MELMTHDIAAEAAAIIFSSLIQSDIKKEWIDSIHKKLASSPITHVTAECLKEFNRCLASECSISKQQVFEIYQTAINSKVPTGARYKSDVLTLYGEFAVNQLNDLDVAYNSMKDAIELSPNELQYRINFSLLLIVLGKFDEAESQIEFVEEKDVFNLYHEKLALIRQDLEYNKQNRPS